MMEGRLMSGEHLSSLKLFGRHFNETFSVHLLILQFNNHKLACTEKESKVSLENTVHSFTGSLGLK